jgi:CheY-like chemotaxis protein
MDIMMPEMDGFQTMKAIREIPEFRSLPIVALTAKAMKGDREKCLEAGASDYVTKPVDLNNLFSVLRVWICDRGSLSLQSGVSHSNTHTPHSAHRLTNAQWAAQAVEDDRANLRPGDRTLLIVDDDPAFAGILIDLAHEQGLKAVAALQGAAVLSLARACRPVAITLDIALPDAAGWTILDRLKQDPKTRHIPVHIISGDENGRRALALGAMSHLVKNAGRAALEETMRGILLSAEKRVKKVLLAITDPQDRELLRSTIAGPDIEIVEASGGGQALEISREHHLDGLIIDVHLPEIGPETLLTSLHRQMPAYPPAAIFYSREALREDHARKIRSLSRTFLVRHAATAERLLNECVLLLHREEEDLSDHQRQMLEALRRDDRVLRDRKVLVVDDDLRNIFALTSLLEEHNIKVFHGDNGRAAIDVLHQNPDIDIVLMDIMMPEMDGFESMEAIRNMPRFRSLPIIALTANAMKADREKCLQAGACDYVAKPVDLDQLLSMLRVWMPLDQDFLEPGDGASPVGQV